MKNKNEANKINTDNKIINKEEENKNIIEKINNEGKEKKRAFTVTQKNIEKNELNKNQKNKMENNKIEDKKINGKEINDEISRYRTFEVKNNSIENNKLSENVKNNMPLVKLKSIGVDLKSNFNDYSTSKKMFERNLVKNENLSKVQLKNIEKKDFKEEKKEENNVNPFLKGRKLKPIPKNI